MLDSLKIQTSAVSASYETNRSSNVETLELLLSFKKGERELLQWIDFRYYWPVKFQTGFKRSVKK